MVYIKNGIEYMPEVFSRVPQSTGSPTYPEDYSEEPRSDSPAYWEQPPTIVSPTYPEDEWDLAASSTTPEPTNDWEALPESPRYDWEEQDSSPTYSLASPKYDWEHAADQRIMSPTYSTLDQPSPQYSPEYLKGRVEERISPSNGWNELNYGGSSRSTSNGRSMEQAHSRSRRSSSPSRQLRNQVRHNPYSRRSDRRDSRRFNDSRRRSPPRYGHRRHDSDDRRRRDSRREDRRRASYSRGGHRDCREHGERRRNESNRRSYNRS